MLVEPIAFSQLLPLSFQLLASVFRHLVDLSEPLILFSSQAFDSLPSQLFPVVATFFGSRHFSF